MKRETADSCSESWQAMLSLKQATRAYLWTKRVLDVGMSLMALLVLLPVLVLIALAIRLDSPGPSIFKQERMGYDGRKHQLRPFPVWKFRTMYQNCDQTVHQKFVKDWIRSQQSLGMASQHSKQSVLARDQRVTRAGRILRKTSLDELPQLWNVLKGEMSMVGPRPVPVYEVAEYQPWHMLRLQATPGLTCLWQISARGQVSLNEWSRLDIEYINTRSLWLDLKILLLTVPAVLSGEGAV